MTRALKAWTLLLLLGLVLPLGGAPLRYCLCFRQMMVAPDQVCPCDHKAPAKQSCCSQEKAPAPKQAPSCMLVIDSLPDAIAQGDVLLPAPAWVMLPPAVFTAPPAVLAATSAHYIPFDRGPPWSGPPPYLRHCSLLL